VNATRDLLQVFQSRKMAVLLLLGFSSGLPLFLTSKTLQLWMQDAKIDLGTITLFSLVGVPYSLKFLWSPLLDRFVPPILGRRRSWLILTQVGLVLAIAAMALQQPSQNPQSLQILAIIALIITFLSATQDIAGDAYRTDVLSPLETGAGASVWVLGYRMALLVTGFLALVLADYISWNAVYLFMAAFMGVGIIATLFAPTEPVLEGEQSSAPISAKDGIFLLLFALLLSCLIGGLITGYISLEQLYLPIAGLLALWIVAAFVLPKRQLNNVTESSPQTLQDAVVLPFQEFFGRFGLTQASLIIAFILLYKLGDSLVGITANLFLQEIGFSKTDIGAIQGGMGFFATTVGVLAGGAILTKIGMNRALWIFGILQLVSNLGYYALAVSGKNYSLLVLAINIENLCAGLITVVTVAYLMSLCNHSFTTTQFALFSSLVAISRDIISAPAGQLAIITGWSTFFLLSIVAAIPGLTLLPFIAPWNSPQIAMAKPGLNDDDY